MIYSASREREAGFTVIEIIVVLALLALAYALVAPSVAGLLGRPRFDDAVRQLIISLREARATAITTSRDTHFAVASDRRSWRAGKYVGTVAEGVSLSLKAPVGVVGATPSEIVFFPDGSSTGGRFVLTSGRRARVVVVDWVSGRISERPE